MHGDYNHLDDLPFSVRQTLAGYRHRAALDSNQMDTDFSSGVRASNSPLTPEFQHQQQQHQQQQSLELATIRHPGASSATPSSEDLSHNLQQLQSQLKYSHHHHHRPRDNLRHPHHVLQPRYPVVYQPSL